MTAILKTATALLLLITACPAQDSSPIPSAIREHYQLSSFYQKYGQVRGFPVVASEKVENDAIQEAVYIINSMVGESKRIEKSLVESGFHCAIMAYNEYTTDIPEHADLEPKDFWDRRARGLGPTKRRPCVSCAEENLLQLKGDPYLGENILIHEFAHAIHEALKLQSPSFDRDLEQVYKMAIKAGLWSEKYAAVNHYEYFAECVQSYFGDNRENDASHNHVNTREELKGYDPRIYELVDKLFQGNAWQYLAPSQRKGKSPHPRSSYPNKTFEWPPHLERAMAELSERKDAASAQFVKIKAHRWTVWTDIQLLEGLHEEKSRPALALLNTYLAETTPKRIKAIWVQWRHPEVNSLAFYPDGTDIEALGLSPKMVNALHIPNAQSFQNDPRSQTRFLKLLEQYN